jgi:bifunctional non-homologous end joining protein LigD
VAKAKLAEYEAKRDFSKTPEPSGQAEVLPSARTRFVIQKHAATRLHYDLRLEHEGVFLSWAVTKGPSLDPHDKRLAVETEPHPLDYGDFEGTIPKGQYGGGTVMLWDRGYWEPDPKKPIEEGLKHGHLYARFEGERLNGAWHLVKLKNDRSGGKRTNWLLFKATDGAEQPGASDELLRRRAGAGRTRSSSTATACRCGWRAARRCCAAARASTGRTASRRSRRTPRTGPTAWWTGRSWRWTPRGCRASPG